MKHRFDCRVATGPNASKAYPTPILFRNGEATLPSGADLLWLVRGMQSVIELATHHPNFLNATTPELLGLTDADSKLTLEIPTMTGDHEGVVVRNSSVLSTHDVEVLRAAIERREVEKNAMPPPAPRGGGGLSDEDESGSSCTVM